MKRKLLSAGILGAAIAGAILTAPVKAQLPGVPVPSLGISIGVKAGTLGIGAEVGKKLIPHLGARVGVNFGSLGRDFAFSNIDYRVDLKLSSVTALLDLYLIGPLRLSAGLAYNKNRLELSADPTVAVQIGNTTYQATDVGTITGTVDYARKASPYISFGIGGRGKIGFILEFGGIIAGDLALNYIATTPLTGAAKTAFDAQVANETAQVRADINDKPYFKIWPVIALGLQVTI